MPTFNIGDRVRWVRAVGDPQQKNAVGIIIAVITSEQGVTMYDVKFDFGRFALYSTQIEHAD
jgi:hypothetical protein